LNYVANNLDCGPTDPDIYPDAPSLPDGKDNNCNGEVDKVTQSITMEPIPDQVDANGSVKIVASASSGLSVNFSIDGPADLFNEVLIFTGAGMITITTSQSGNSKYLVADPVTISFCVNPLPTISATAEGLSMLTLQSNYETGNQWYLDETMIDGATEQQYIVKTSGNYSVIVIADGCIGGSEGYDAMLTSVEVLTELSTTLYPNPAQNYLNVELSGDEISEVYVVNSNGSIIMTKSAAPGLQKSNWGIDISDLQSGTYLLMIKTRDEVLWKRFSKR